jgi:hypothetical protein
MVKLIDQYYRNTEIKEEIELLLYDLVVSGLITKEQYELVILKLDMVM